jgi:HME family heavy-metal exporter
VLNALIRFSLAQRGLVLMVAAIVLALGVQRASKLPIEVLPDLTRPTVTILTEAPGYSPEEVETLVTIPLENALMGVTGISRLRSTNDISLSLVFVEFDWDTDIYKARQFVQERLENTDLPENVTPYMTPVASLMGNIMLVGLVDPSSQTDPGELRGFADWTVARRLQAIPGIAEVLSMGGGIRQMQIQPLPHRMRALGVSFDEIIEAAEKSVANTTGGFLTGSAREIMVRNLSMTTDPKTLSQTVVRFDGHRAIQLGDVARVLWDTEPRRGDAGLAVKTLGHQQGYPGVILSITKSPGFDTIDLTRQVEHALSEIRKTIPDGLQLTTLYCQSDFIDIAIGNLRHALRDGAVMVAIVLFLFLLNFRITLITLTAIPLSLGITILVFDLMNLSVNSMTLGGLAVAIGMVVDDAIVDVENVFRRLVENASKNAPRSRVDVIATASAEVRASIFYATLLIILVFVPLLGLTGVEGRLFAPIAIATIVSMAASFVVSLSVIPVLSFYLLRPSKGSASAPGKSAPPDALLVRLLKRLFLLLWLRPALRLPLIVVAATILLCSITVDIFVNMGGNFLPPFREPSSVIATTTAPGTSLGETNRIAARAQDLLLKIPEVESIGYRVGRAERGDHVVPVSTVEFDVEFDDSGVRSRAEIIETMRETMKSIPGTFSAMSGPLADRIGHMLAGVAAKVAIKVHGDDLAELRRIGDQVAEIAREIPGLEEARAEQLAAIAQLRILPDNDRCAAYGIAPGEITTLMGDLMAGKAIAELYEGQRSYDLVVRLPPDLRENPARLGSDLYLRCKSGLEVPLSEVAAIRPATGPNVIQRENTRRRFVVSINPTTADLNTVVETLEARIDSEVELPEGYSISIEGEYRAQQNARQTILLWSVMILIFVTALLWNFFRSFTLVLLVLTNIPISMIGGILLTHWTIDTVSIATLVGMIAIAGISARNTIMMLSHYLHLMRHEGESFGQAMIIRGTQERLVPVLMTALSAGIALIPIVLAADQPGKEILNPVAVVIVGGLVSSTLLGLAVTPALFHVFGKQAARTSINLKSAASG